MVSIPDPNLASSRQEKLLSPGALAAGRSSFLLYHCLCSGTDAQLVREAYIWQTELSALLFRQESLHRHIQTSVQLNGQALLAQSQLLIQNMMDINSYYSLTHGVFPDIPGRAKTRLEESTSGAAGQSSTRGAVMTDLITYLIGLRRTQELCKACYRLCP